ncbi:RHS repeat-associated core domain-containing protein [Pirellulaceae bacterium SH449]
MLTSTIDPMGRVTSYEYDNGGRVSRVVSPDPDGAGPQTAAYQRFIRDSVGNVLQHTDSMNEATGHWTVNTYDAWFRPLTSTDPGNTTTSFGRDVFGNLTSVIDGLGNQTLYTYNKLNQLVVENKPIASGAARNRTYSYDAVGNIRTLTDRNNRVTQYSYDNLYRMTSEQWATTSNPTPSRTLDYSFDSIGNLTGLTDSGTWATNFEFVYDARNQPVVERQQRREVSSTAYVNLVRDYDAVGNRVQTLVNFRGTLSGQTVSGGVTDLINSYQFDGLDRLVSVTQRGNLDAQGNLLPASNGVAPKTASFQYDAASQLTDMRRYASTGVDASQLKVHSRMGYDGAGRLQSITHGKVEIAAGEHWNGSSTLPSSLGSTHMLAGYYFTYDTANRLTSLASQRDRFETSYGYDNRHQLTSTTSTAIAGMGTPDYLPLNEGYAWDATGNRLGSSGQSQSATGTHNRLQSDGTYSYLYDNEGNVRRRTEIATGQVRTFTWDHRNRLARVIDYMTLGGTLTKDTLYYYDAFDRLVAKRINDNGESGYNRYESWIWDGQEIAIQLRDADGVGSSQPYRIVNRYQYGPAVDMVLADERYEDGVGYRPTTTTREAAQGQTLWTLTDHLGSVRDLVDNAGVVRRHVVYDSFGGRLHEQSYNASGQPISPLDPGAVDTIFGYTGRQWDSDVELQYNRARWYDPQTGRWLSQDPIGFNAGDANLYRYVGNGPTNATDPSGLEKHVDPEYAAGREELQRIYRRYAELYGRNPDKYLWAGLATHAGSQVITEIYDRLERKKLAALDHAVCLRMNASGSFIAQENIRIARIEAQLMIDMQRIILQMAKDIESDIGKQFEAYDSGGLAGIDGLIAGGMPGSIRGPWEQIDSGDYAGGSEGLTQREQTTVLNPGYGKINGLIPMSGIGIPMSWEAKSGLDNCPTFSQVSNGWFTDTRGPDKNARWIYIRDHVLKRWNSMTRQERDDWVKKQLGAVNSPPVSWP